MDTLIYLNKGLRRTPTCPGVRTAVEPTGGVTETPRKTPVVEYRAPGVDETCPTLGVLDVRPAHQSLRARFHPQESRVVVEKKAIVSERPLLEGTLAHREVRGRTVLSRDKLQLITQK